MAPASAGGTDSEKEEVDTVEENFATGDMHTAGGMAAAALPGGMTATAPDHQGQQRQQKKDPLLLVLLEFVRRVNACIARQGRDRVNGRFFGQDIRDAIRQLTLEEQDNLSDEDYVAVLEDVNGKTVVRIGFVEALTRVRSSPNGKRQVESATRLAVDDPSGQLVLRILQPDGMGK